jgi:hypothetical protein
MSSIEPLGPTMILRANFRLIPKISLLFLLTLAACSPAFPIPAVELQPTASEAPATPTTAPIVEETSLPTSTPEQELIYPYYLPLATKPDIPPQTINGITGQIDWAYVDESRISVHYTISGLDWPEGTMWDMSPRVTSTAIPETAFSGAGGWNNTPVEHGVITGTSDQFFWDGAVDAGKDSNVDLILDIPVEGPTPVGTFHFEFDVSVLRGLEMENIDQTVVANNVSMTLKTLVLNPSYAEALLCFQMPSPVDWGLTASKITLGGREFPFSGGGDIRGADGKGFLLTDLERCTSIGFNIPYDESDSSILLTVPKLVGSLPEVVTEDRVQMANQRLADKGIQIDYENIDHGGNIVILERPEGATDVEIYPLIWDALAEQYEGPWTFTVEIPR